MILMTSIQIVSLWSITIPLFWLDPPQLLQPRLPMVPWHWGTGMSLEVLLPRIHLLHFHHLRPHPHYTHQHHYIICSLWSLCINNKRRSQSLQGNDNTPWYIQSWSLTWLCNLLSNIFYIHFYYSTTINQIFQPGSSSQHNNSSHFEFPCSAPEVTNLLLSDFGVSVSNSDAEWLDNLIKL